MTVDRLQISQGIDTGLIHGRLFANHFMIHRRLDHVVGAHLQHFLFSGIQAILQDIRLMHLGLLVCS